MRHTGIRTIGDVPWGTHFCQFYQDQQDLADILVPYFKAGLENNEFCMWVTSEPLRAQEARAALAQEIPNLEDYFRKGQIEILDYRQWYTAGGGFSSERVLQGWVGKLEAGLQRGFDGLRLTGNTFWLEKADWQDFAEYEAAVDRVIGRYRMLAICTYSLAKCGAAEIMDVVANHAFALVKRAGQWQVIENSERKRTEERYSLLFEQMTEGFALHEIICDESGAPCDYRFLEINPAFERLTGLKRADVLGRTMREVLPHDDPKWIEMYGTVALNGEPARFEKYSPELKRHYDVLAFRPAAGQFAVLLTDITARKQAEGAAERYAAQLETILGGLNEGLVVSDLEGRLFHWNQAAMAMHGFSSLEECRRRLPEFEQIFELADLDGNVLPVEQWPLPRILRGEQLRDLEIRIRRLQGGWSRILSYGGSLVRDPSGQQFLAVVNVTDITDRKRAEQALRESEARRAAAEAVDAERYRLNEILDKLPVMVCLITPDLHLPFANRMFRDTFGDPQGRTCYKYIFNLDEPCPQCESLVPLKTGRPHRWVNPCPGGRLVEAHDFPFTDVDGAPMILEFDVDITERRRLEEELRTASRYARSLIEASLDPLVTISPEGTITDVNRATELVTGVARERLIGTRFSDYFTQPQQAEAGYHKVLSEGLVRDYPLTIRHADGRTTDVLYNASLYRNEAGEVQGVFAAARDVTERKRMDAQLHAATETLQQLAAIVESSDDAITGKTLDGTIISWNQSAERIYGYTAAEMLGKSISLLVPPDRPDEIPQILDRIRRGERVEHYETVRIRKDGSRLTVSLTVSPIKDAAGRIVGASTIARDVTERKRMEEEVHAASLYARSLIEASLDPLVTISPDGKITDVNEATELVTGVPSERLIGSSFSDYFTEPHKAEEGYQKVLGEGLVRDYPLTIRHPSGRTTDVLYNASVYRNQAGEVQGVFAAARDVTVRKRMEEELRAASLYARSLIEASLDPLVTISPGGQITDVNRATELVTGVARERLIGSDFSEYFTEPERARAGYRKVLSEGLVRDYPLTIRQVDGHTTDVLYNAVVYRNEAGQVQGVFAAARDVTERKRLEEELRVASLHARSLIEASLDPLVTISPEGQITDVNRATELVTGVARERLIGSDFSEYFTEPDQARAGYRAVLAIGLVRDYPLTIRHVEGHTTDVLYNAVVYRNGAGQVQGVFAAARDVTERKRLEEELRVASLYARSLIEASLDPLVTISPDGQITDVNRATELVTGVTRERLIGSDFSEYFTEPDKARAGYRKVLSEGLVRDYPLTIRHVVGPTTDVLYNAVVYRNQAGQVQGVFAAARDVTERKRLEEELRVASLYARSLIEASLDPLVTISPEGQITDVNEATELVTGVARERLIGSDFSDYFTEPEMARAGYRQVLSEGLVRDYPLTIRHVDGHTTDVLYNAVVYRNEAGQVQGVFAAARDVTQRKRAEAELERYRGHLEELVQQRTGELETANAHLQRTTAELVRSNQELEQFAYVASHDLQEPLRAVTGYLGLIEQQLGEQLDDKARHYMAGAAQGAARMHTLITDLLALSRVGTRGQAFEPADLNAVLDQALDGLGASVRETGARITRDAMPTLRVDAGQIAQLFQNLIGNALKFRAERPPEVHVGARRQGGEWVFSVRDNGIGIEPQYFERIFLVFQRLHTRQKYPGTGIGLAICKKIVERHGGTIRVESQPEQGATFYFTIPEREML